MGDGSIEALAEPSGQVAFEPIGMPFAVRRDDNLAHREVVQCVVRSGHRVAVADLAGGRHSRAVQVIQRPVEPLLRCCYSAVDVWDVNRTSTWSLLDGVTGSSVVITS